MVQLSPSFPGGKEPAYQCRRGDAGLIPGFGRSLGGGHGNPPQYSCLENTMDSLAGYSPQGRKELDTTEATEHSALTFVHDFLIH